MFKVLDTYRRSVDYYNSFGLKSADGTRKNKVEQSKPFSAANYKWGYNWLILCLFCCFLSIFWIISFYFIFLIRKCN